MKGKDKTIKWYRGSPIEHLHVSIDGRFSEVCISRGKKQIKNPTLHYRATKMIHIHFPRWLLGGYCLAWASRGKIIVFPQLILPRI